MSFPPILSARTHGPQRRQRSAWLSAWGVMCLVMSASAQERVSDRLLVHHGVNPDTTALHWRVPAQRLAQVPLQRAAQEAVRALQPRPDWIDWFERLSVTGRLPLATTSPRALQVLPREDPVLGPRDELQLYPRPAAVAVLGNASGPCLVAHAAEAKVLDYVRACWPRRANDVDWVWWVAPSGESARVGVAAWNQEPAPALAPGAWLWAPNRDSRLMSAASANIAKFLATQPPLEFMPETPDSLRRLPAPSLSERPQAPVAEANWMVSSNDWGETGLLQTPTARMMPEGSGRFHLSRVQPYTRGNFFVQPFEWLETGFRYTNVSNRLGPEAFSGTQALKDKSIDVRLRLKAEDEVWPQLTAGIRDIGGTGLFSSEYLVASKRWGDWDTSLGLGWGNLGSRADVRNPLLALGRSEQRMSDSGAFGGTTNTGAWFTGPTAVFGGVQYRANAHWLLKAELDGNDYQHEPQSNAQTVRSRVNVGAVYRQTPYVDWTFALERGQRLGLGVTLHSGPEGLSGLAAPKLFDAALPAWGEAGSLSSMSLATSIQRATGWRLVQQRRMGHEERLRLEVGAGPYLQDRLEAVVRLAHLKLPAELTHFAIELQRRGLGLQRLEIDRAEWVLQRTQTTVPALRLPDVAVVKPRARAAGFDAAAEASPTDASSASSASGLGWEIAPHYHQILGGPNGFLLYQLGVRASVEWSWRANAWLGAQAQLRAVDNYEGFVADAPDTGLPKVRSDLRRYVTTSRATLPNLQATRVDDWGGGWFSSAYAGYLEPMFAGAGGEVLVQPWGSRWALGIDVNRVQQRAFDQGLQLRDYAVNTGHLSAYLNTGVRGIEAKVSVGRYLATDWGATLDLSRRFNNGVAMGFWATKTNVSAAQFGEGSFDKGFYVSIPFDAMLPMRTPGSAQLVWSPLTRDGGARLNRRYPLYDLLRGRIAGDWAVREVKSAPRHSGDVLTEVSPPQAPSMMAEGFAGLRSVARGAEQMPLSTWAWALGSVAMSARLDRSAHDWASTRSGGVWSATQRLGKVVPYALIAGAAATLVSEAPQGLQQTARTALVSGASAYALNQGLRFLVGRARPTSGVGPSSFDGGRGRALQSSFASNHTALAFALATPFAQNYDAPWLYGAAALTGLSRVQSGDHWLSDVVAGGLLGYGVASWANADARRRDQGWHWTLGWNQVGATYIYR